MSDDRAPGAPEPPQPQQDPASSGLTGLVVARGAAAGLLLATPAALANVALADQTPKPKGALNATFLVLLVAFALAGWLAGREAPTRAAQHGAAAAAACFAVAQVIGIGGRLDRGEGVALGQIIVVGLLAACVGTLGARLGASRRARKEEPS